MRPVHVRPIVGQRLVVRDVLIETIRCNKQKKKTLITYFCIQPSNATTGATCNINQFRNIPGEIPILNTEQGHEEDET